MTAQINARNYSEESINGLINNNKTIDERR